MKKLEFKDISFKRISSAMLLTIIFGFSLSIFINGFRSGHYLPKLSTQNFMQGDFIDGVENFINTNIPSRQKFLKLVTNVKVLSGNIEQHDVFIADDMLIEKIDAPKPECIKNNTKVLKEFGDESTIPVYLMLTPSKSSIKQEKLPDYIPLSYSEKKDIESIYEALAGKVSTVDVYTMLFSKRNEYIYYKTEPGLTNLGGYYAYTVLADRIGKKPNTIDEFSIEYLEHEYYGETYYKTPCSSVTPDIITLYHHHKPNRKFIVTDNITKERFNTLYPEEYSSKKTPKDIILGGQREDISIFNAGPYDRQILIIGDSSAVPLLPFLATQMAEVRFINMTKKSTEEALNIDADFYDQILFLYSAETYIHSDIPSKVRFKSS